MESGIMHTLQRHRLTIQWYARQADRQRHNFIEVHFVTTALPFHSPRDRCTVTDRIASHQVLVMQRFRLVFYPLVAIRAELDNIYCLCFVCLFVCLIYWLLSAHCSIANALVPPWWLTWLLFIFIFLYIHTNHESLGCLDVFTVKSFYCLKQIHKYFNPATHLGIVFHGLIIAAWKL